MQRAGAVHRYADCCTLTSVCTTSACLQSRAQCLLYVADYPLLVAWLTQLMLSAGHGTWHCHCHSTGLSHVLGQKPCFEPWWRQFLLVILNIVFLVLVALAVVQQGQTYFWTFLRKAQTFSKAALRLVKAAFSFLKAPFVRKGRQPCLQLTRPRPNTAEPVRATRTGSLQPMLAEMMVPSQPTSLSSSWSHDGRNH